MISSGEHEMNDSTSPARLFVPQVIDAFIDYMDFLPSSPDGEEPWLIKLPDSLEDREDLHYTSTKEDGLFGEDQNEEHEDYEPPSLLTVLDTCPDGIVEWWSWGSCKSISMISPCLRLIHPFSPSARVTDSV